MPRLDIRAFVRSRNGYRVVPSRPGALDTSRCPRRPEWWAYDIIGAYQRYVSCVTEKCPHDCGYNYRDGDWLPAEPEPEQGRLFE